MHESAKGRFDALVFGELSFPGGGLAAWQGEFGERLAALLEFDQTCEEEVLSVTIGEDRVSVRAWLLADGFQAWCPRLEAMFSAAARVGAEGEIYFADAAPHGAAYRLSLRERRSFLERVPFPGFDHPAVAEIVTLAEDRAERARRRALDETYPPIDLDLDAMDTDEFELQIDVDLAQMTQPPPSEETT
jgi:hypothetical protein